MGYRWKPNKAQKAAYKAKMEEKESLPTFTTGSAIRTGCFVKFYSINRGTVLQGLVVNSSYGEKTNQHTFTIDTEEQGKVMVKGRNLYPNILAHEQGEESKRA